MLDSQHPNTHSPATRQMLYRRLHRENRRFVNTGGVSRNNRRQGFEPAFMDTRTGQVYRSMFADGRPAPIHVHEGLPEELLHAIATDIQSAAPHPRVVSGFTRNKCFFTRQQAAEALSGDSQASSPH